MKSYGWALVQYDWYPHNNGTLGHRQEVTEETPCGDTGRRWPSTTQGEKPQKNPVHTLILDFQPLEGLSSQRTWLWQSWQTNT